MASSKRADFHEMIVIGSCRRICTPSDYYSVLHGLHCVSQVRTVMLFVHLVACGLSVPANSREGSAPSAVTKISALLQSGHSIGIECFVYLITRAIDVPLLSIRVRPAKRHRVPTKHLCLISSCNVPV